MNHPDRSPPLESQGVDEILSAYRKSIEKKESGLLHPRAARSSKHSRFLGAEDDHRLPYKRDVDRIIHSKAYCRYVDKTQVVYLVENDHVTHRGLHVQLVSNFARGIAEILELNVDLVEAIALGHDVGHPPFGHEGENYLCALSRQMGQGAFAHPWQSCRLLRLVEPLNLGFAVYDGFLCHDGGMKTPRITPQFDKTWEMHFQELEEKLQHPAKDFSPATLEGALVKLCDTMSYLGRDIEDAISLEIISRSQVPVTLLGTSNGQFLSQVAQDIIKNSYGKNYIQVSEDVFAALKVIRAFNFKAIYNHPKIKVESEKVRNSYKILVDLLLEDLQARREESHVGRHFLSGKPESYWRGEADERLVIDYVAGMTDGYFIKTFQKLIVPQKIEL